jgi:hypothetical protein
LSATAVEAIKTGLLATLYPRRVVGELVSKPNKVAIAAWINVVFAFLYALTALVYYFIGRLPAVEPWMPIDPGRYYIYQVLWTVPWGLATWIMFSGIAHLLAVTARANASSYRFEDALAVCAVGWVVPRAVLMWIPATILVPILGVFWPRWIETLRLMVIPVVWQVLLVAVGLRQTHQVGWPRGIGIGLVTVIVPFVSFLAFMRYGDGADDKLAKCSAGQLL